VITIGAFFMTFFAEMGDKSQLLAWSLATRYPPGMVLLGVAVATLLNNGLAILLGIYIQTNLDIPALNVIASLLFIFFGVWRLLEKERETREPQKRGGVTHKFWYPLFSIITFLFLAEMGDKTQMATVAYVINYQAPVKTLVGVVAGMVAADAIGIFGVNYLARFVSPLTVKLISSSVFIIIGVVGLFLLLPNS